MADSYGTAFHDKLLRSIAVGLMFFCLYFSFDSIRALRQAHIPLWPVIREALFFGVFFGIFWFPLLKLMSKK